MIICSKEKKIKRNKKSILTNFGISFIIVVLMIWTLFPIVWMIQSACKTEAAMFTVPPQWFFRPTFFNFRHMVDRGVFIYLRNSLIASISSVAIAISLGSLAGYAIARGKLPRKKDIAFWMITTRMAPIVAVLLPLYMIFRKLNLNNTLQGLIIAYTTFNLPLSVWLMNGFFKGVPREVEESSLIDGCGKFQAFLYISLPLVKPGLLATAILCFIFAWNDYLFAVVLTAANTQTLPVVAARLMTLRGIMWGQIMAMGTIIFIPVLIAGVMIRKYLVRGLTMGAVR